MAKRIKDAITPGALKLSGAKSKPAKLDVDRSDIARQSSGMAPDQWNAAIRLQCGVRDWIDRPVTLAEALTFARHVFTSDTLTDAIRDEMRRQFDEARKVEQDTKDAAMHAARKLAG